MNHPFKTMFKKMVQAEGRRLWAELHTFALVADAQNKTHEEIDDFLRAFRKRFPPRCECRNEWDRLVNTHPPDYSNLFLWTVLIHNRMNVKLEKPEMAPADARKVWEVAVSPIVTDLTKFFDAIYCINLDKDTERWETFQAQLKTCNWPFGPVQRFSALQGDKIGIPLYFHQGGGAWGCLRSHLRVLEMSLMADHKRILVMEDDADLRPEFGEQVRAFLQTLAGEPWDCLMLGGQHMSPSVPYRDGIVKASPPKGIQRTHCMAFTNAFMGCLYRYWSQPLDQHCDWAMGPFAARYKTFAPEKFIVGQRGGLSGITNSPKPPEWWNEPEPNSPIILLKGPREILEPNRDLFHAGMSRDKHGIDMGLADIFQKPVYKSRERRINDLTVWLNVIRWESESMPGKSLATIWHPDADEEIIKEVAGDRLHVIASRDPGTARTAGIAIRAASYPSASKAVDKLPSLAAPIVDVPLTAPSKLSEYGQIFERVAVINLDRRPERWEAFLRGVEAIKGWPWRLERFSAIDGSVVPPPRLWEDTGGYGGWGCMASHRELLTHSIQDGIETLCIFEDDAEFAPDFAERFPTFWNALPDDWEGLLLGCQHVARPLVINPYVLQTMGPQRTHAYVFRRKWMKEFLRSILSWNTHLDWKMEQMAPQFKLYTPTEPLVYQCAGVSDIDGREHCIRGWAGQRPPQVFFLQSTRAVMESLSRRGFHFGYNRRREDGCDEGLHHLLTLPNKSWQVRRLRNWILEVGREADSIENGVLALWRPVYNEQEMQVFRDACGTNLVEIVADSVEDVEKIVKPYRDAMKKDKSDGTNQTDD